MRKQANTVGVLLFFLYKNVALWSNRLCFSLMVMNGQFFCCVIRSIYELCPLCWCFYCRYFIFFFF